MTMNDRNLSKTSDAVFSLDIPDIDLPASFKDRFASRTTEVNGSRIHYVIGGSGDALVLLHGWPETWFGWRKIMPSLAEHFTVIAIDLPGFGESDPPSESKHLLRDAEEVVPDWERGVSRLRGFDKRTIVEYIRGTVRSIGFTSLNLLGHDMGGAVVFPYAFTYPNEVDKLIMMDTAIVGFGLEPALDWTQGGSYHFAFNAQVPFSAELVQGKERFYIRHMFDQLLVQKDIMTEEVFDVFARSYEAPNRMRYAFEYYAAFLDDIAYNREHFLGRLTMPVLALSAAGGPLAKLGDDLKKIADDVTDVHVEGSGHWIAEEQPERTIDALLKFLK